MKKSYILSLALISISLIYAANSKYQQKITIISEEPIKNISTTTSHIFKSEGELYSVIRSIDGDTIIISYNDVNEKVRLIGVNTPESVDPRKKVECFGKEASLYTKSLLENRKVRIEFDATQDRRDKYGRLLAYIFRDDGLFVNQEIIKNGYGYEYTYKYRYKYENIFKKFQNDASLQKLGLWRDDACANII